MPLDVSRLFLEQQLKSNRVKTPNGMRWHPMIIRRCLYLRHKSTAAYESLSDSCFINLHSSRTLYDYSHYRSAFGFEEHSVQQLCELVYKENMIQSEGPWKSNVGVLFDEIPIETQENYGKTEKTSHGCRFVGLFEEHCEGQKLKLKRPHVDLTAFSCRKKKLVGQILCASVANALEFLYDDSNSETIQLIINMNKFLNVRSLLEERNTRNPNLKAFTSIDDPRLQWLQ